MILTMTWIYGGGLKYLLQCNASNIGWYFKARNFCILEKVSERQGGKNNSSPLSRNMCSSSHWFIKHSAVTIMLCCVSSIICQQTVFGYHRSLSLSLSAHITHFLSSLWVWAALCSSLFATNLSIITQPPWSFDSHVSPWISYFIQQLYKNRIKI